MTITEKLEFLAMKNDFKLKKFLKMYKIPFSVFNSLNNEDSLKYKNQLSFLCNSMNFDLDDFVDNSSSLDTLKDGEHFIKTITKIDKNAPNEDYPKEDNARYEDRY